MTWIGARYRFASTFSYRIPNFSSSYALSALAPSPSTVKLALVSSLINRIGDVKKGESIFNKIHKERVVFELPSRIVAFKSFMKRLKKKRQETGFERTFGIREYVLYDGDLWIHFDISPDHIEEVDNALKMIQYFGTSDSLCFCLETSKNGPMNKRVAKPCTHELALEKGIVFLLSDFVEGTTFDMVNPYSGRKMEEETLSLKPYLFPIEIIKKDKNCTIYQSF